MLLAGCSHGDGLRCEPTERYAVSQSVGPVQIPDDLTPPDESDALQLPAPVTPNDQPAGGCLEDPPKFSRDNGANSQPAAPPPRPVPTPSPDRAITN